jgi:NTE family protein
LIVEVNALRRDQLPRQAAEIFNRLNEITFNSALVHEIDLINTMNKLFENGNLVNTRYKPIRFHAIGAEEELSALDISSKVDCSWEFLRELHALGR